MPADDVDSFLIRVIRDAANDQLPCRVIIKHVQTGHCCKTKHVEDVSKILQDILNQLSQAT